MLQIKKLLLFILSYGCVLHAHDSLESFEDRPCFEPDIVHEDVTIRKNLELSPEIVSFSKNISLLGTDNCSKKIRDSLGNTFEKDLGYRCSRVAALGDDIIYWFVYNEAPQIHYYDSKVNQKGVLPLSKLIDNGERISRIKLSKKNPNHLFVFSSIEWQIPGIWDYNKSLFLNIIDVSNGKLLKRILFTNDYKICEKEDSSTGIHLVETAQENQIVLYRRACGEERAWEFDAAPFNIVKQLPFDRMKLCKANDSGLVVFAHNHNTISVVKTEDLSSVIYTINMREQWPSKMHFINQNVLLVVSQGRHCDYCYKNKLGHSMQNALSLYDLENQTCVYREKNSRVYSRIKPDFDENGNIKKNSAVMFNKDGSSSAWYTLLYSGK